MKQCTKVWPEDVAQDVLFNHWDKQFPVDLVHIAEERKIAVKRAEKMEVGYCYQRDDNCIRINGNIPEQQQRLELARALGHYFLGHASTPETRAGVWHPQNLPKFHAANAFAMELLMPYNATKERARRRMRPADIAHDFNVPEEIMMMRLSKLNL